MADSNVAPASGGDYEVFLSFRGPDTRNGFTDFLYHDLIDVGVRVFRDDEELRVGEEIYGNLLDAINNSIIYIPIFSSTYASSKWCLWELAQIVDNESKSEGKKSILPIFLDVEPDDVKLKKNSQYEAALLEHEKQFPDEVKVWRAALAAVGKIKGLNVKSSQAEIVEMVVENVLEMLEIKQKLVTENLVGLDHRVKDLIELLDVNHCDVQLTSIYGMGGIGKTTFAKVIFNRLSSHFGKCCSFLESVRESSSTMEGIVRLQKKLLSDIVGSRSAEQVKDSEQGMRRIGEVLRTKKVLVVLDDVAEEQHIENLIGNYSLRLGSRIIITTRNKNIPLDQGFNGEIRRYEMLKMDATLALQLFCRHAFGRDFPSVDYHALSSEIVSSTGGLPLAIEVIGSSLKRRDKAVWEETLVGLKTVPEEKILKKLKISYDGLDKNQKQIFLDIACFFFNKKKTNAMYMWASCQFNPKRGIEILIEKCLIKILENDKLWMHDQIIALGRQIVREDSRDDLGKQSRLWMGEEAVQIMGTKERKHEVHALEIFRHGTTITNEDFERLPNLRFLKLSNGTFAGDFARCRSNLRWFSWHSPLAEDFRADNMHFDRLVVCKLEGIHFKEDSKAWDLIKYARDLKVLSLTRCSGMTAIPDISKCSGLERLTLERCSSLKRIESFIGNLQSLIELKIERCKDLTHLPEEIGALVKLKHFSLSGCSWLRELPSSIGNLASLSELNLSDTIIRELPNFIGKLKSLRILPKEMEGEIPVGIEELLSLRILNLESTGICEIPRTINMLHHLQTLNLSYCHAIQELPELPTSLTCLLLKSESLLSVPNLSNLTNLVTLLLSDGSHETYESNLNSECSISWIGRLPRLRKLELNLLDVPAPLELASLSHLEELTLSCLDLQTLVLLPSSGWSWRNLSILTFCNSAVEDIPLDRLPQLEKLTVYGCERLLRLSIPLELRKLREADVKCCPDLVEIQVVGLSKSMEYLSVHECESLTRISGLSYLKNLEKLEIIRCNALTNVEGLNEVESLKSLEVLRCPSLRSLIDASCPKVPEDCLVSIEMCGYSIKDSEWRMSLKRYIEEILLNTSNKTIYGSNQETGNVPANRDLIGVTRVASSSRTAYGSGSGRGPSSRDCFDFRKRFTKFKIPAFFRRS